jgi:hypothetical protein
MQTLFHIAISDGGPSGLVVKCITIATVEVGSSILDVTIFLNILWATLY